MQLIAARETLDGGDRPRTDARHGRDARADGAAVQQHRARAALPFTATVLGAREIQLVVQNGEQTARWIDVDSTNRAVYVELENGHALASCAACELEAARDRSIRKGSSTPAPRARAITPTRRA